MDHVEFVQKHILKNLSKESKLTKLFKKTLSKEKKNN